MRIKRLLLVATVLLDYFITGKKPDGRWLRTRWPIRSSIPRIVSAVVGGNEIWKKSTDDKDTTRPRPCLIYLQSRSWEGKFKERRLRFSKHIDKLKNHRNNSYLYISVKTVWDMEKKMKRKETERGLEFVLLGTRIVTNGLIFIIYGKIASTSLTYYNNMRPHETLSVTFSYSIRR